MPWQHPEHSTRDSGTTVQLVVTRGSASHPILRAQAIDYPALPRRQTTRVENVNIKSNLRKIESNVAPRGPEKKHDCAPRAGMSN